MYVIVCGVRGFVWCFSELEPTQQRSHTIVNRPSEPSSEIKGTEDEQKLNCKQHFTESYRRTLNWYIGRRPRTAFSSTQVKKKKKNVSCAVFTSIVVHQ